MKVVLIPGSLREGSYNRATAKHIQATANEEIDIVDIRKLPLYNEDIENEGIPPAVRGEVAKVASADGVIFITPEYNGFPPGALVNATDWFSRPSVGKPLINKPVGTIGASPGGQGAGRAQNEIRGLLNNLKMVLLPGMQLRIGNADSVFDSEGNLTDQSVQDEIKKYMENFIQWVKKLES